MGEKQKTLKPKGIGAVKKADNHLGIKVEEEAGYERKENKEKSSSKEARWLPEGTLAKSKEDMTIYSTEQPSRALER